MPFLLLLLIFFSFIAPSLAAPLSLTPEQLAAQVRNRHPQLAAARQQIAEARARAKGAGRLANPELGVSHQRNSRFRDATIEVSLDQRFPLTGRLRLEKSVSAHQIAMAEWEVREIERQLIAQARTVAVQRLSLAAKETLWREQAALADALATFAQEQVAKGEFSPLDAGQLTLERTRLELEGRNLAQEGIALDGALRTALGLSPQAPFQLTGRLASPSVPPLSRHWQQRPDYQLALLRQKSAGVEVELARSRRWEDISAGVTWEHDGAEKESLVGVQIGIPLPLWNRNQGEIAEKQAATTRVALESRALAATIAQEVATAHAEMKAAAALAKQSLQEWLPLARKQAAEAEAAYRRGESDLFAVLRAREQHLQMEAAAINALGSFHLARVRYQTAVNQP